MKENESHSSFLISSPPLPNTLPHLNAIPAFLSALDRADTLVLLWVWGKVGPKRAPVGNVSRTSLPLQLAYEFPGRREPPGGCAGDGSSCGGVKDDEGGRRSSTTARRPSPFQKPHNRLATGLEQLRAQHNFHFQPPMPKPTYSSL